MLLKLNCPPWVNPSEDPAMVYIGTNTVHSGQGTKYNDYYAKKEDEQEAKKELERLIKNTYRYKPAIWQ